MNPVLLKLGPVSVYAYGTMLALAFGLGTFFAGREARARGIAEDHIYSLALVFAVFGVAGARALHVLLNLSYYLVNPLQIFALRNGGLALHGGFVAAILAGVLYAKWQRLDAWELADFLPKWGVLGIGIVRFGCLMNGCCFGVRTDGPFGLDCSSLHDGLRHPTQLYEAGLDFLLFAFLLANRRHRHFKGWPAWMMVGGYSVIRGFVEIWRYEPKFWGPFKLAQLVSIVLAVAAFAMIPYLDRRRQGAGNLSA
ncbi:MAG: prolipoprotein diacylglyceryl transferase [Chitinophagales bacterium]